MKILTLPHVPSSVSPVAAFQAMQWLERAAVIRQSGEITQHKLIAAPEIVWAVAEHSSNISEIVAESVYAITDKDIRLYNLDLVEPEQNQSAYRTILEQADSDYALIGFVPGLARIAIRNDNVATSLAMAPKTCYCKGPFKHGYPEPPKKDGEECDICVHIVRCVSNEDLQPSPRPEVLIRHLA